MRKGLIVSFFLFLILSVYSQDNLFREQSAQTFFKLNYPYSLQNIEELSVDTSFVYRNLTVVNFSTPKGFVILRSTGENQEIMGYSYSNHFSFEADTTGVLESWADALSDNIDLPGYSPDMAIPKLKTGRLAVEPMCQTAWNQGAPYNYYCPFDHEENKRTIVGCVAVAVGQIIRYYDKWNDFQIQYSYEHEDYGVLSCFAGNYNWGSFENKCYGLNHEVARLLYHSGVLVNMGYGTSASGASSSNAASLFNRIYDGGYLNTDPYAATEAYYNSISKYKPIYSTYTGHAFVCDGYDGNDFYHFNLGWGGSANGFYPLTNVLDHELLSAIFDTSPRDSLKPPGNLKKRIVSDAEMEVSWNGPEGDREELTGYSIYLDDVFFEETTDTLYMHTCQPGSHYIRVTANYSTGESRWIGPASYFSHGESFSIADDKLRVAMNTSIGVPSSQRNTHEPTKGELNDIRTLSITNGLDLTGIEHCVNLRRLVLLSTNTTNEIDLSKLEECSDLTLLEITRYHLVSPETIGSLVKLQELKLYSLPINELDFLSTLKDLYKLDINDIPIENLEFMNGVDRLSWIKLTRCGIESFDVLENTFGVEYLDISYNEISDIEWLNGNKTLSYLDASENQLSGEINLDGFSMLRTLVLSNNQIQQLNISNSPTVISIEIGDNQINSLTSIIEGNALLTNLDVSNNLIDTLPAINNKIVDLDLSDNLLFDLVPIDKYGNVTKLDLQDNRITDLSPLMYRSYAGKLEHLNLRDNPISKESYQVYKPQISDAAGTTYFPSRYHPASPCYMKPTGDSVVVTNTVNINWEGDYDEEGYQYDLYMSREEEAFSLIAEGITSKSFETELNESGNYTWYVIAHLEDDSLFSGYAKFKVFSGFTVPFFEDFEIYTPNEKLCLQTPYWRVFDENSSTAGDAYVVNIRSYEGDNSIKISGSTDLLFPVTEYLTGYLETSFMMMVDNNRQATIRTFLRDGSLVDIYFYSAGICEVYHDQTKVKFFSFNHREWMKMEIVSDDSRGLEWTLDNQELFTLEDAQPIDGIRFCTIDGPGYYESAPTVMYLDNFAIDDGTLLSVPSVSSGNIFEGKIYCNGEEIILEDLSASIERVELYNIKGQKLNDIEIREPVVGTVRMPFIPEGSITIVVLTDNKKNRFSKKLLTTKSRL